MVLFESVHNEWQGNLLLYEILGAEIRIIGAGDHDSARPIAKVLADDMRRLGRRVYFADLPATSVPVVFPAYLLAAEELAP